MSLNARVALLMMILAATSSVAWAQFGTGQYGNLVWDADKNCWVRIDRDGFARRLVDGDVLRIGDNVVIAGGQPYFLHDGTQPGGTALVKGTPKSVDPVSAYYAATFDRALDEGRVPSIGPNGETLAPGAREFIAGLLEPGGYSDVGGRGGTYGDVDSPPGSDFWDEDKSGVAASIHINGYGTIYLTNAGNTLHLTGSTPQSPARISPTTTTSYTGIGTQTSYAYQGGVTGNPGDLQNITYHVDPTSDRVTMITVTTIGGQVVTVGPTSGTGLYFDPYAGGSGGSGSGGGVHVQQFNPTNPRQPWVEPVKKDPPKPKKQQPAAPVGNVVAQVEGALLNVDWEPDFGFGAAWHRRFLEDRSFNYDPVDRGEDAARVFQPGIQVSFLGPPPLSDEERNRINGVADDVTALGDKIEERRRNAEEQRRLIAGQQEIFDIMHTATVGTVDKAREQAKSVIAGQIEAAVGVLLGNADEIKKAWDRMPDGPAKQQLGKVFDSDGWDAFLAGGKDSVASGAFDSAKFVKDLTTGGVGEAALNFLPDNVQLAVGQIRAAHRLSQAVSGLIEGTWNANELEELGEQIGLNQRQYFIYSQGTRELLQQQELLVGQLVDLTTSAVRNTNGLQRVGFINSVIQELENNSGGIDVTDQLTALRQLRDETVIYLPGGEWGVEPVLYERLWLVPNAAARYRQLVENQMRERFGPDWNWANNSRPGLGDMFLNPGAIPPPGDDVTVTPTPPTPPPSGSGSQPGGVIPVTLPDGTTATAPADGAGPITMPDGSHIHTYPPGSRVQRVVVLPGGTTVTRLRSGQVEVVGPDGTITIKNPDGSTRVILPDGTVITKQPDGSSVTETANARVTDPGNGELQITLGTIGGDDMLNPFIGDANGNALGEIMSSLTQDGPQVDLNSNP